jgi:outer membrane protein
MKHFKTLFIAAVLFMSATTLTIAQSKIAHINTTDLVTSMPDMKTAPVQIEEIGKNYEKEIQGMVNEYKKKIEQYEKEAPTKTDDENQTRSVEVQTMQQKIQQYQTNAQQELQKKEGELLKPITEKAKAAILKVAKAQGFNYVLDSSQGGGVIMAEGKDLLKEVQKELGF